MERTAHLSPAQPSASTTTTTTTTTSNVAATVHCQALSSQREFAPAVMLMLTLMLMLMLPNSEYLAGTEMIGTAKMPLKHAGTTTP